MILVFGGKFQGKHDFAEKAFPGREKVEFEELFGRWKGMGEESSLLSGDMVLIADENSSGIVPSDPAEYNYRERYNALLLKAAARADEVYRVFCGIGIKIR